MQNGKQKPSCFSEVAGGERRSRTEGRTQGQAHSSERPVATHVQAAEPSRHRGPRCRFLNGPAEIDSKSQWRSGSWVRAPPCSRMPSAVFVLFAFTLNPRNQTPASAFPGGGGHVSGHLDFLFSCSFACSVSSHPRRGNSSFSSAPAEAYTPVLGAFPYLIRLPNGEDQTPDFSPGVQPTDADVRHTWGRASERPHLVGESQTLRACVFVGLFSIIAPMFSELLR